MISHPGLEFLESRRLLSAGDLDGGFGNAGVVTATFGGSVVDAQIAVQSNGKMVVAMVVTHKLKTPKFVMARFTDSGMLDKKFGRGGLMRMVDTDQSLAGPRIDSQNRIIVGVGKSLLRFTPNGHLDATFGKDGVVDGSASDLAVRPDGKMIALIGQDVERFNADGTLDTNFGKSGITKIDFDTESSVPGKLATTSLVMDHLGRIDVGVEGGDFDSSVTEGGIIRINSDGTIDQTFFGNGYDDFVPPDFFVRGMTIASNGNLVVNEDCEEGCDDVVELNSQGKMDKSFSGGNRLLEGVEQGESGQVLALPNGQLIVALHDEDDGYELIRLNGDGTLDPAFGGDGRTIIPEASFPAIAELPGGDLAVAGTTEGQDIFSPSGDLKLLRVQSSPPVAPPTSATLDSSGQLVVIGTSGEDQITISQDETTAGAPLKNLIVSFNGVWEYFDASTVKSVVVDSGDGDDSVDVSVNLPTTINGGNGDDDLTGPDTGALLNGEAGNDRLAGGAGSDTLLGGGGNDSLTGGDGADLIDGEGGNDTIVGLSGADTCYGGSGIDALDCSQITAPLTIKLDNAANDGIAGEKANVHSDIEAILGGGGNDLLIANSANTLLDGGLGNDTLWGGTGNDTLFGDVGNDEIHAKDGHVDTIDGGTGTDKASVDDSKTVSDVVSGIEDPV